jgi:hypothetical protein
LAACSLVQPFFSFNTKKEKHDNTRMLIENKSKQWYKYGSESGLAEPYWPQGCSNQILKYIWKESLYTYRYKCKCCIEAIEKF